MFTVFFKNFTSPVALSDGFSDLCLNCLITILMLRLLRLLRLLLFLFFLYYYNYNDYYYYYYSGSGGEIFPGDAGLFFIEREPCGCLGQVPTRNPRWVS